MYTEACVRACVRKRLGEREESVIDARARERSDGNNLTNRMRKSFLPLLPCRNWATVHPVRSRRRLLRNWFAATLDGPLLLR